MLKIEVTGYTLSVDDDGLMKVNTSAARSITVVHASEGNVTEKRLPYPSAMARSPIIGATWGGDGWANVDLDCGAQRWNGSKTMIWIRKGLVKMGFSSKDVDRTFRAMRKHGPQSRVMRWY